jgi:hypothetical protein
VRYVLRTGLGMALFAFCWVAIGYSLYQLLQVGTCASGGPYVPARECPDGIERLMFSLIGGIFGMFLAAGIYMGRGAPPGSDRKPQNAGIILWFWTGLFWTLAVSCFLGVWGPDANPGPGGKTGGLIVGFMGLLFGAGGVLALKLGNRVRDPEKLRKTATKLAETASRFAPTADPVDRLDTLDRLRREGTLTDAEFETLKTKIVRED